MLLPFACKPEIVDPNLKDKLTAEWPGILSWAIEGCLEWNRIGLGSPARVLRATQEYFEDEDTIGKWAAERVVQSADGHVRSSILFQDWCDWCGRSNEMPGTQKRFSQALTARNWKWSRDSLGTRFNGIALLPPRPYEFPVEDASIRIADVTGRGRSDGRLPEQQLM